MQKLVRECPPIALIADDVSYESWHGPSVERPAKVTEFVMVALARFKLSGRTSVQLFKRLSSSGAKARFQGFI